MADWKSALAGLVAGGSDNSAKNAQNGGKVKNSKSNSEKGVTLIAANSEVNGDVHFVNQLYINGIVRGNVTADAGSEATVVVSEEGSVAGEIRVPNVVINGRVEGNVYATNRMELAKNAEVKGNVYYKLIEMQLGAMVDGQLVYDETIGTDKPNVHPFPESSETSASSAD